MAWLNSSWTRRIKATVKSTNVDSNLTDFACFVDLNRMPTSFWNTIQSDGDDLRVTTSDGTTEVPFEFILDTADTDGFIYWKGDPQSASDVDFYIYYGNASASGYGASDTYGSQNVWKSAFACVLHMEEDPSGSAPQALDSTSNGNDATSAGSMTSGDLVDAISHNGYDFDGSDDYLSIADDASLDLTADISVSLWIKDTGSAGTTSMYAKRDGSPTNYGINYNPAGSIFVYFYDGGAFRFISDTWSNHFTSDTWHHVVATYSQNGSDVDLELFVDGVSAFSGTVSNQNLVANNHAITIAATDTTILPDELLTGQVDEFRIASEVHSDAWIKFAHAIEDDNPTNVELGAPEAETAIPEYNFTYQGRQRTWTGGLYIKDVVGNDTEICIGDDITIEWGSQTNTLDSRMRGAEMQFDVFDPEFAVYNALTSEDYVESDWYLEMTDSTSTYTVRMKVRIDELETLLFPNIREQITRVYCYCGLAEMKNIDAVTSTSSTFSSLLSGILISNAIDQDIDVISMHYPENIASTGVLYDLIRLQRLDLIFVEDGRKQHNMYDQLKGILEGFGMWCINSMDGKWHVKHEYALGETLTGKRGAMRYSTASGAFSNLTSLVGNTYELSTSTGNALAVKRPIRPVQAVEVERGSSESSKFITVDMVRFGDFEEGWDSATSHQAWTFESGGRSTSSDTGTYAGLISTNSGVYQDLPRFSGGQALDFELTLRLAMRENTLGSGTSRQVQLLLRQWNDAAGGSTPVGWGGTDGWSESLNALVYATQSVGAASSLIYTTVLTTFRGPMLDEDGYLQVYIFNTNTDKTAYLDTVEVRIKKSDDAESKFIGVASRYDVEDVSPFNTFRVGDGAVVKQRVHWWNGLLGLDVDGNDTRDSTVQMMQALTNASGSWIPMADWTTEVQGFEGDTYSDLFDLVGEIRVEEQDTKTTEIEGEISEIVPPDYVITYDDKKYVQVYTKVSLKTEVTTFVADEKTIDSTPDTALTNLYIGANNDGVGTPNNGFFNVPKIATEPWATSSDPFNSTFFKWDPNPAWSKVQNFSDMEVDTAANNSNGYVFGCQGGDMFRWDLDGSNLTTLRTTEFTEKFALDRRNQKIYITGASGFSGNIIVIDYDGNTLQTISTLGTSRKTAPALDQSGIYLFYVEDGGGLSEEITRYTIATGATLSLGTFSSVSNLGLVTQKVDQVAGKVIIQHQVGANLAIYEYDYPSGTTLTLLISGTGQGITLDMGAEQVLYPDVNGDVFKLAYTGGSSTKIADFISNMDIDALGNGKN